MDDDAEKLILLWNVIIKRLLGCLCCICEGVGWIVFECNSPWIDSSTNCSAQISPKSSVWVSEWCEVSGTWLCEILKVLHRRWGPNAKHLRITISIHQTNEIWQHYSVIKTFHFAFATGKLNVSESAHNVLYAKIQMRERQFTSVWMIFASARSMCANRYFNLYSYCQCRSLATPAFLVVWLLVNLSMCFNVGNVSARARFSDALHAFEIVRWQCEIQQI